MKTIQEDPYPATKEADLSRDRPGITLLRRLYHWRLWKDCGGQDLVEFALLVALVGVASGLFMPTLREGMDTIYSRMQSKLIEAGG